MGRRTGWLLKIPVMLSVINLLQAALTFGEASSIFSEMELEVSFDAWDLSMVATKDVVTDGSR
jgi:hypothetical protein